MTLIDAGRPAPGFCLRNQHGREVELSNFLGKTVVVYFYPEDDTPLCTAQACQFRDHHPGFAAINAVVIGISPQGPGSHDAFARGHGLPFTLLADEPDSAGIPPVSRRYGAWGEKNMYGRIVTGMIRTTYLIGPDGRVARRWDRVKTPGHAAAVLEVARRVAAGEPLAPRPSRRPTAGTTVNLASKKKTTQVQRARGTPSRRLSPKPRRRS